MKLKKDLKKALKEEGLYKEETVAGDRHTTERHTETTERHAEATTTRITGSAQLTDNVKSERTRKIKPQTKFNPYEKAVRQYKTQTQEVNNQEASRQRKEAKSKRSQAARQLNKRTRKGQPILANHITHLLRKLQN